MQALHRLVSTRMGTLIAAAVAAVAVGIGATAGKIAASAIKNNENDGH